MAFCDRTTDSRRWKDSLKEGGVMHPNFNINFKTLWKVNRAASVLCF